MKSFSHYFSIVNILFISLIFFSCESNLDSSLKRGVIEKSTNYESCRSLSPSKIRQYDEKNKLTKESTLEYDLCGNLTKVSIQKFDGLDSSFFNYLYDDYGNVSKITLHDDTHKVLAYEYHYGNVNKGAKELLVNRMLYLYDKGDEKKVALTELYFYDEVDVLKNIQVLTDQGIKLDSLVLKYGGSDSSITEVDSKFSIIWKPCHMKTFLSYESEVRNPFYSLEFVEDVYLIPSLSIAHFTQKYNDRAFSEIQLNLTEKEGSYDEIVRVKSTLEFKYVYTDFWKETKYPSKFEIRCSYGPKAFVPYQYFEIEYN